MNPLLAGEIGGGQPAAFKRRQKLGASGGIGAGRAATWKNTVSFHGRGFITARWKLIGGLPFTAYVNKTLGLSRQERRRLRAAAHQMSHKSMNEVTDGARARLEGKIAYLAMLNPQQASQIRYEK